MGSSVTSDKTGGVGDRSPDRRPDPTSHPLPGDPLVMVPYVAGMLCDLTDTAARSCGLPTYFAEIDPALDSQYARLLDLEWDWGRTFINLEQDIVPPAGAIKALAECPEPWCLHAYSTGDAIYEPTLGLTKFGAALMESRPDAMRVALWYRKGKRSWCHWRSCSEAIASDFLGRGWRPHVHTPPARHLHHYPTR